MNTNALRTHPVIWLWVITLALFALLASTGCATKTTEVITTRFSYNTNGVSLVSPKDVTFDSLKASDGSGATIEVHGYGATANAAALASTTAQAAILSDAFKVIAGQAAAAYAHQPPPVVSPLPAPPPAITVTNKPAK